MVALTTLTLWSLGQNLVFEEAPVHVVAVVLPVPGMNGS